MGYLRKTLSPSSMKSLTILCVLIAHLSLLSFIAQGKKRILFPANKKPIVVKSFVLASHSLENKILAPILPPKVVTPKPKTLESKMAAAKTPEANVQKSKSPTIAKNQNTKTSTSKEKPKKTSSKKETKDLSNVLKELRASIDKTINKDLTNSALKSTSLPTLAPLNIDAKIESSEDFSSEKSSFSLQYQDMLVAELQQALNLPEYGEVQVKLSITFEGKINNLVILSSKNEKNKNYLKNEIPRLSLSHVTWSFPDKKEHTFVITFKNKAD